MILGASIIAINLLCTGCHGDLLSYRFDSSVSQHHRQLAKEAADCVCEASDGLYCPVFFKSGDSVWRDVESFDNPRRIGYYLSNHWNEQSISIKKSLPDELYIQISIHELSHEKCKHLHDGSVMEAYKGNVTDDYNEISVELERCLKRDGHVDYW